MEFLNKKQKIAIAVVAVIALIFIGYYIINKAGKLEYIDLETEETYEEEENKIEEKTEAKEEYIIVHITGAVEKQGIVETKKGSRISDVIKRAGGVTEEADLTKINLAYEVKDGQKIYVPNKQDQKDTEYVSEDAGETVIEGENNKTEKVNINTATQAELETLDGVGPSTALKIINYRTENGKFKKIEDITNVPGIGESKFKSLKESICT